MTLLTSSEAQNYHLSHKIHIKSSKNVYIIRYPSALDVRSVARASVCRRDSKQTGWRDDSEVNY